MFQFLNDNYEVPSILIAIYTKKNISFSLIQSQLYNNDRILHEII